MKLQLIAKTGIPIDEDVYEIIVPTSAGRIAVYDGHMPIMTDVTAGMLSIRDKPGSQPRAYAVNGGLAEVQSHQIRILADDITADSDINEQEALMALEKAKLLLAEATDKQSIEEARQQLTYSSLKLEVARSKKRRNV